VEGGVGRGSEAVEDAFSNTNACIQRNIDIAGDMTCLDNKADRAHIP